jgi:hypothetical protein
MKWFTLAVLFVNLCIQVRRWRRKGIAYVPIVQLKLTR